VLGQPFPRPLARDEDAAATEAEVLLVVCLRRAAAGGEAGAGLPEERKRQTATAAVRPGRS
jgi:hypothetical protein